MNEQRIGLPALSTANKPPHRQPAPGMTLGDVYYVLFRHKWKIALVSAVGLIAAIALDIFWPITYESEARLFVRYVVETKTAPGQVTGSDSKIQSTDQRGQSIMSTELEILSSIDVSQMAAVAVGPQKILAKSGGGTNLFAAIGLIRKNLQLVVPKGSTVIHVTFQHPDPEMAQAVLTRIIESYLKKHVEVHGANGGLDEFLTQETDQLKSRLAQTEEALRRAKSKAGVISLEDSKKAFTEQISMIRRELFNAEAEMAERQTTVAELKKLLGQNAAGGTNEVPPSATTNQLKQLVLTNEVTQLVSTNQTLVPPAKASEHKKVATLLDVLGKREQDLSLQFTGENAILKNIREQIAANEKVKQQLEIEYPELAALKFSQPRSGEPNLRSRIDPSELAKLAYAGELDRVKEVNSQIARMVALQSKVKVLNGQMEAVRKEIGSLDDLEGSLSELMRKRELEQSTYKQFAASLEQSRINEAMGADRVSNISKVQSPSPPYRSNTKLNKILSVVIIGSIALALALAFALEFLLDQTLKHPNQVEAQLGLPLLLAIPASAWKGDAQRSKDDKSVPLLPGHENEAVEPGSGDEVAANGAAGEIAPWDPKHKLHEFFEVLRDRLIVYFEVRKLTRKPKLVAVTGCARGSGVTTIAAGLAASLSETGDGRVLLVDMNLEHGAAHDFYKGNLMCGIDDALEAGKRDVARVQENLYVVTEGTNSEKLPRFLPKRFSNLVPKLKASDYDYIIFDLPPISDISITPRLARFMDTILLVVESEKTDRDVVKRAAALMGESQQNLNIILNQSRTYLPHRLQQEV